MSGCLQSIQTHLAGSDIPWQRVILSSIVLAQVFEVWVGSRQRPFLSPILYPTLPPSLKPYITSSDAHETYSKSQAYAADKLDLHLVLSTVGLVQTAVFLTDISKPLLQSLGFDVSGEGWTLLKAFWKGAEHVPGVGAFAGEARQSAGFVALTTLVSTILSIPGDYYKNFVMEDKHGFNNMKKSTFVKDIFKGMVVSLVFEIPLTAGIVKIVNTVEEDAILRIVSWTIVFIFIIQIAMLAAHPYLITPLFNKFTLLAEDSPVYPYVKSLAHRLDFPLGRVWVVDGSTRSSHSSAYFFGLPFFTKHIVIYDTLLAKTHELGHWKGTHAIYLIAASLAQIAFALSISSLLLNNRHLLASFGFYPSLVSELAPPFSPRVGPTVIALYLAATLFTPLSTFLKFITNSITRRLEYDADAFAAALGGSYRRNLKKALVTIHEKNLAVHAVDPIYSALHHDHPTLVERLEALDSRRSVAGDVKSE
ncbi:zinc metalloprotease [Rhodotorula kratochvilovae]